MISTVLDPSLCEFVWMDESAVDDSCSEFFRDELDESDVYADFQKFGGLGTIGYMEPEYMEIVPTTPGSDIYSFGVLILELLCQVANYYGRSRTSVDDDCCQCHDWMPNAMTSPDNFLHTWEATLQPDCFSYMSGATKYKIMERVCEGHTYRDLKPSNILLDHLEYSCVPKVTDSQILKLLCGGVEIPISTASTHNSLYDVNFTVAASAKGDNEIKTGYYVKHMLNYLCVHHPRAHMVLFAHKKFVGALKSMAPKGILDMAKRLSSSALHNVCKADWISPRPISELPKVGTVAEYNTGKNVGSRKDLTEYETRHSVPDSCGAEHGIKEWKQRTSTAWVVSTAAPHHATGNRNILSGFITDHDDQFVHAVDGVPMKVLARGAVVTDAAVLPDVWFVPGLTANLVSVSQLAELGYSVRFDCGECYIRSAADGMIVGKARLHEGGLYVLDFLKVSLAM